MKLKFLLLEIITLLNCASCSLLDPTAEKDAYGNKYTTNNVLPIQMDMAALLRNVMINQNYKRNLKMLLMSGILNLLTK